MTDDPLMFTLISFSDQNPVGGDWCRSALLCIDALREGGGGGGGRAPWDFPPLSKVHHLEQKFPPPMSKR